MRSRNAVLFVGGMSALAIAVGLAILVVVGVI